MNFATSKIRSSCKFAISIYEYIDLTHFIFLFISVWYPKRFHMLLSVEKSIKCLFMLCSPANRKREITHPCFKIVQHVHFAHQFSYNTRIKTKNPFFYVINVYFSRHQKKSGDFVNQLCQKRINCKTK